MRDQLRSLAAAQSLADAGWGRRRRATTDRGGSVEGVGRSVAELWVEQDFGEQRRMKEPGGRIALSVARALKQLPALINRYAPEMAPSVRAELTEAFQRELPGAAARLQAANADAVLADSGLRGYATAEEQRARVSRERRQYQSRLQERANNKKAAALVRAALAHERDEQSKRDDEGRERPSADLRIYDLQRQKADRIDAFVRAHFHRWTLDHPSRCGTVSGNGAFPCLTGARMPARDDQTEVGRRLVRQRSIALFWPPGWGKTRGAVLGAQCALHQALERQEQEHVAGRRGRGPRRPPHVARPAVQTETRPLVVVVTKAALLENFRDGLREYYCGESWKKQDDGLCYEADAWIDEHYRLFGFEKGLEGEKGEEALRLAKGAIVVVDEPHELRTAVTRNDAGDVTQGKSADVVIRMCQAAHKVVLTTGTPMVNGVQDLYNIALMMASKDEAARFRTAFPTYGSLDRFELYTPEQRDVLDAIFGCRVSYIDPKAPRDHFPSATTTDVVIEMDPAYLAAYRKVEEEMQSGRGINVSNYRQALFAATSDTERSSAFLLDLRRAANRIAHVRSPKIDFVVDLARKAQRQKLTMIVHSFFVEDSGLAAVADGLKAAGVSYREITGKVHSQKTRSQIAQDFNDRKFTVILISKAGGTGITLLGASYHVNFEPPFNSALADQASARGVRYKSHVKRSGIRYPPAFRAHVDIYNLFMAKPDDLAHYIRLIQNDAEQHKPGAPDAVIAQRQRGNAHARPSSRALTPPSASSPQSSPAKRKRPTAKRSPAKRAPAKRAPAKRAPAKRAPAKRAPAKRAPAHRASVKPKPAPSTRRRRA